MSIYKWHTKRKKLPFNREDRAKTSKPLMKSVLPYDAMRYDYVHELRKKIVT